MVNPMNQIQHLVKVVSNQKLCERFYCLTFESSSIARQVKPGQFVHIKVSEGFEPFFRRPFSVYRAQRDVQVFYEVVGRGTQMLSEKKLGDVLDVLGPLGKRFSLPEKKIKQVVMIAGGIGIAPFLIFSDELKKKKIDLVLLYGARTKGHVYPMKEFKQNGCRIFISTDDGSVGIKGRISKHFDKINLDPQTTFLYTCGPVAMMKAVQDFANKHQLSGQACCEEVMACALGACLGCSIETTEGFKTVCYDGPVFDLKKVIF